MATAKQTLFEQIREEDRATKEQGGLVTSLPLRIAIIVTATLALAAFLPGALGDSQGAEYDRSRVGSTWTDESVVAAYPFPVTKNADSLAQERARAQTAEPARVRRTFNAQEISLARASNLASRLNASAANVVLTRGRAILNDVYTREIIDGDDARIPTDIVLELGTNGSETVILRSSVRDSIDVAMTIDARLTDIAADDRRAVVEGLHACIVPTLRVDERSWQEAQSIAVQNVATTAEIVQQGDVLVRKGQRVDAATIQRLAAYRHGEALRSNSQFSFLVSLGALGHAAVLISIIVLYLYFIRRISYLRNGQLATLVTMPVISAVLGWLTIALPTDLPLEYSIIVPGFAMLVSILYDARTSIVVTLVCSLAAAAARGNDHVIAVVLVVGGAMAAYSATNLRSRTQVFTSIAAIFVGLAVVTVSISLERATPLLSVLLELGGVAVNAVVSPLLAIAIVLVMERSLNIATDLRLEDFDNINHPLLQQLNERAPGTYQHTMAVARLSESAAAAIGANALLARVGALYHDIGKIEKSEYFIENQIDIDNKHDRLPPKRSAAIIRQHVQDGVELAREYRLPERIWKFIPMHHGTIVIKHFYALAVADAQTTGASVDEADFRYPGPKPDSKETAIVMLADVCEAISRLVDTSHREDIERAVEQVILDRITDGQLSEAPLTLADLDTVRESFVKSLLGSSHQRVRYRDVPESTDSAPNS